MVCASSGVATENCCNDPSQRGHRRKYSFAASTGMCKQVWVSLALSSSLIIILDVLGRCWQAKNFGLLSKGMDAEALLNMIKAHIKKAQTSDVSFVSSPALESTFLLRDCFVG